MLPLQAALIHSSVCKPIGEKSLTLLAAVLAHA